MVKDIIKLVIAMWIVKHFVFDNDLLESVVKTIKQKIEGLLK